LGFGAFLGDSVLAMDQAIAVVLHYEASLFVFGYSSRQHLYWRLSCRYSFAEGEEVLRVLDVLVEHVLEKLFLLRQLPKTVY